jgi:uncharacterized membrane protein
LFHHALAPVAQLPVRKVTADKVREALSTFEPKGKVLQTSLTKDKEDELRQVIETAT